MSTQLQSKNSHQKWEYSTLLIVSAASTKNKNSTFHFVLHVSEKLTSSDLCRFTFLSQWWRKKKKPFGASSQMINYCYRFKKKSIVDIQKNVSLAQWWKIRPGGAVTMLKLRVAGLKDRSLTDRGGRPCQDAAINNYWCFFITIHYWRAARAGGRRAA